MQQIEEWAAFAHSSYCHQDWGEVVMGVLPNHFYKSIGILVGCALLIVSLFASILLGQTKISIESAIEAFTQYDESSTEQIIVKTTRMPRAFIAAAIGASLAIAGALMQALTKNPLASPSVLGINSGAAFFVVLAVTVFSVSSMTQLMWIAFAGAAVAAAAVYLLGSLGQDGLTPLKIILAGAAMTALFSSFTQGMLVLDEKGLDEVLFWLAGSVAGRTMEMLSMIGPYMAVSWVAAILLARHINVLMMGDDTAKGLGQRTVLVKLLAGIIIVLLAGGSVAVAGPIGFIGLVVPHIARYFAGIDFRWMVPYSALIGAILLLLADIVARFVIMPEEIPVGVMTTIIGTPFFIYIARKGLAR
jgi:iron complex transport system permease protein